MSGPHVSSAEAGVSISQPNGQSSNPARNVQYTESPHQSDAQTLANSPNGSFNTPKASQQESSAFRHTDTTVSAQSGPSFLTRLTDGAHHKSYSRVPFLHRPQIDSNGPWLDEEQRGEEWISLFYDLAIVAVLTIFSSGHELNSPGAISLFFSYFAILNWMWVAQTHYDVRFQAADAFHRFSKGVQIASFVYIGAASGSWNPGQIRHDGGYLSTLDSRTAAEHRASYQSFQTVVIAFIVSRAVLAMQYVVCILNGRRVGRKISGPFMSVISLVISAVFALISVVIPSNSAHTVIAKIVFFYMAIFSELVGTWSQIHRRRYGSFNTEAVGERYGAFTLIILGEGFISITRAFNSALSGLSTSTSTIYIQVFVAIIVMYMLWNYLFARFNPEDDMRSRRVFIWEFLHFPLHFNLLLLLAAMVNTIACLAFAEGLTEVTTQFQESVAAISNGTALSESNQQYIEKYIDLLYLEPAYSTEMSILANLSQEEEPTEDPTILAYQYLAQITLQVVNSYGMELEDEMIAAVEDIYAINSTWSGNETLQEERQEEAADLIKDIITIPAETALSGILWIFPTGGAALILAALRSMAWYRFQGPAHWIVHGMQIGFGLALALLGLLDIGSRTIDVFAGSVAAELQGVNPMYWLVHKRMPLAIIAIVYVFVYAFSFLVLGAVHRRTGTVWPDEEKRVPPETETRAGTV